jgi:hypothetical protein
MKKGERVPWEVCGSDGNGLQKVKNKNIHKKRAFKRYEIDSLKLSGP